MSGTPSRRGATGSGLILGHLPHGVAGAPGVFSARYGGIPSSVERNNAKLLQELDRVGATTPQQRSARFRCVLVLAREGDVISSFEGACEGTIALGESETQVRTGDFIAIPRGAEYAHRLTNSSEGPLRYLCFSTMIEPDVAVYPDSNKVGFFAGSAPGGPKELRRLTGVYRRDSVVGYFDGEPDA